MAGADARVVIRAQDEASKPLRDIGAAGRGLEKDLADVGAKGSSHLGKLGSAFGDVAKIASGFVIGQGLLKLPGLMSGAISAASELEQSIGGVQSVFGESADKILAWGKTAHEQAGLSADAFNKLAAPVGAMLKNAGFSMDEVTGKTIDLTQKAADLAATFGGPVEDAMNAIGSLMRGESNPIERYGVAIKQSDVNLRALADTGKSTEKDLTALELQQARLALLFEQTADTTGQFGREADTAAGKAERLKAKQENLAAQLGQQLLPLQVAWTQAQVAMVGVLTNAVVPALTAVADAISPVMGTLKDGAAELAGLAWDKITSFAEAAWPTVAGAWAAIRDGAVEIGGLAWDGITAFASAAWDVVSEAWTAIKEAAVEFAGVAWDKASAWAGAAWEKVGAAWAVIKDVAPALASVAWDRVSSAFDSIREGAAAKIDFGEVGKAAIDLGTYADAWAKVKEHAGPAIDIIRPFAERVVAALKEHMQELGKSFKEVGEAFKPLGDVIKEHQETFKILGQIVGAVLVAAIVILLVQLEILIKTLTVSLKVAAGVAELAIRALAVAVDFVANVFETGFRIIEGIVTGVIPTLTQAAKDILSGMKNGVTEGWGAIESFFRETPGKIIEAIGDAGQILLLSGRRLIEGFFEGIKNAFTAGIGAVKDMIDPRNWDIPGLSPLMDAMLHAGIIAGTKFGVGLTAALDSGVTAAQGVVAAGLSELKGAPDQRFDYSRMLPALVGPLPAGWAPSDPRRTFGGVAGPEDLPRGQFAGELRQVGRDFYRWDGSRWVLGNQTWEALNPGLDVNGDPLPQTGARTGADGGWSGPEWTTIAEGPPPRYPSGGPNTAIGPNGAPINITILMPNYLGDRNEVARALVSELAREMS